MWKPEHGVAADRHRLRYSSDLTDAEWTLIAPMISPAKHGGRGRTVDVFKILNTIFYVLAKGRQWKALPRNLPPKRTPHWGMTLARVNDPPTQDTMVRWRRADFDHAPRRRAMFVLHERRLTLPLAIGEAVFGM